jgi:hypothetical protein
MPLSASEIRRKNFTVLVQNAGGIPKFSEKTELNTDYIRQLLNGKENKGGRNIGERVARKVETVLSLPKNWLDHVHTEEDERGATTDYPGKNAPSKVLAGVRIDNDIDAIRHALGAIFTVMGVMRPDEGELVADALRASVPKKFLHQGLIPDLLEALESGRQAAKEALRARRLVKPQSS